MSGAQKTTGAKQAGQFQKGKSGNPNGRPAGVPNKVTAAAKSVIAEAAEKLGGVDRLVAWAQEDPDNEAKFWATIYPKLIPVQVTGEDGGSIKVEQVESDAAAFRSRLLSHVAAGAAAIGTEQTQH